MRRYRVALIVVSAVGLFGCATVRTAENAHVGSPKIYGGTRLNIAAISDDDESLARFKRFDIQPPEHPAADVLPSFVGDTLMLPFSAWYTLTEPLVGRK